MVGDRFRLRYKLTPEHFQSYVKLASTRAGNKSFWKTFLIMFAIGLASGLALFYLQKNGFLSSREISVFFLGAGVTAIGIGLLAVVANKRMLHNIVGDHDAMIGDFTLAAYEGGGLQISGMHIQSSFDWTAFIDLTQSSQIMVLWVDRGVGIILPNSAFTDDEEKQLFVDFVTERIKAHRQVIG